MQSTVIELSRYTSTNQDSNSEWTNQISKPITIEEGDIIQIKQCFIDTQTIDQQSILIDQDVNWTLQFVYTLTNHGLSQFVTTGDIPNVEIAPAIPDGLPYIFMTYYKGDSPYIPFPIQYPEINPALPLVDSVVINIPKGIYDRGYLAEYITRQLQGIKNPQNLQERSNYFTNGQLFPNYDTSAGPIAPNFLGTFTAEAVPTNTDNIITSLCKPTIAGIDLESPIPFLTFYINGDGTQCEGRYLPLCTGQQYNYTDIFSRASTTKIGTDGSYELFDGGFIGTTQCAFTYNDQNSGKFAFQYMHSPLIDANNNESVGTYITNKSTGLYLDNKVAYLNTFSNILIINTFTNLSSDPTNDPFFKQIGLELSDIITPDIMNIFNNMNFIQPTTTGFISYDNYLKVTTKNFYSMSDLVNVKTLTSGSNMVSYASIYGKTGYEFSVSPSTKEIVFSSEPLSSTSSAGHYLIELNSCYQNEYYNQEKNYQVKAVVSNFYFSENFTSSMAPDSYIYQHKGIPMSIPSIKVRILNPVTKQPATNIGLNSTIYLQITKEEKQEIEQKK
jgi:hypothetical protein